MRTKKDSICTYFLVVSHREKKTKTKKNMHQTLLEFCYGGLQVLSRHSKHSSAQGSQWEKSPKKQSEGVRHDSYSPR